MFISKNIKIIYMTRFYFFSLIMLMSASAISQNITQIYSSDFAKLQSEIRKEVGVKNIPIINYRNLTKDDQPYFLLIVGNDDYQKFLQNVNIYDTIRIVYLDQIDFKKIEFPVFKKLINLKAIKINNCKNIDPEKLIANLVTAEKLVQLHFKNLNFKDWKLDVNPLVKLKVLSFENCNLKHYGTILLNLDEFSILNTKKTLDLSNLFIKSVKNVIIQGCKLECFPYSLSTSQGLEYLVLYNTRIKTEMVSEISGFNDLKCIEITYCNLKFNNIKFLDTNEEVYLIDNYKVTIID